MKSTLIAFLILALGACATPQIEIPNGFARFEGDSSEYQLVTPDAVRINVYSTPNQPVGTLATLEDSVELHFKSIGYTILKKETIRTDAGLEGRLFLTSVATLNGEYRYLVSFFPDEETIYIVEAGGRKDDFAGYQSDIIAKIKTLKVSRGL
ncbi:MAG: hypothetical protein KDK33_03130 [Leptospiraceae bacterium]|nr:hypothetical protein [Leptospiraceae bacterium]